MGTEGGATIGWDAIDHFKVNGSKKKKKKSQASLRKTEGKLPAACPSLLSVASEQRL